MQARVVLTVAAGLAALTFAPAPALADAASLSAAIPWHEDDPAFGGLSAIEVTADGLGFVALSDRGTWVEGRLLRDAAGLLTGAEASGPFRPLRDAGGFALDRRERDSEGLAVLPDGRRFVSFEGPARVLAFAPGSDNGTPLPAPREFAALQKNSALEALAVAPDGTLYTLPERSGRLDVPFPVWRFSDGAWTRPFAIRRDGAALPVAADIGPDGRLYILERTFEGFSGFRSRLRSLAIDTGGARDERLHLDSTTGVFGNLEGLSVWRRADGRGVATMVSDNNFRAFLPTQIVEIDLGPMTAADPAIDSTAAGD